MIIIEETLKYLGIAFICSAALIVMSKIILQHLIRRPADFYDAEEVRQEELMLRASGISIQDEDTTESVDINSAEQLDNEDDGEISETRKAEEAAEKENGSDRKLHKLKLSKQAEEMPETVEEEPVEEMPQTVEEEPVEEMSQTVEEEPAEEKPQAVEESTVDEMPQTVEESTVEDTPEIVEEEPAEEIPEAVEESPVEEVPDTVGEEPIDEEKPLEKPQFDKDAIRRQLEQAFDDKIKTVKPSMRLKKSELKAIAEYRGIEIPEKATKQIILDLINAQENSKEEQ